jgi:tRNA A-37 threonylcarbamoyl transferase component Bud32
MELPLRSSSSRPRFTKVATGMLEIELQEVAAALGLAPAIQGVDVGNVLHMDAIDGRCLAELYTDTDPDRVPRWIWAEIHRILEILFAREGIEYVDITAYNFVLETATQKVWIIDFGHAYYTKSVSAAAEGGVRTPDNWFLRQMLEGECGWNPDFA